MARKKDYHEPEVETKSDYAAVADGIDFAEEESDTTVNIPSANPQPATFNKLNQVHKKPAGRPKGSIRKTPEQKAQHFSTSLAPDVIKLLSEQAQKEDRSISKIVTRAIREYVERNS